MLTGIQIHEPRSRMVYSVTHCHWYGDEFSSRMEEEVLDWLKCNRHFITVRVPSYHWHFETASFILHIYHDWIHHVTLCFNPVGGHTDTESHISATRCLSLCIAGQCTIIVEMTQDGSVCHVYRGGHLYRVPLDKNIIPNENYIVYQQKGNLEL